MVRDDKHPCGGQSPMCTPLNHCVVPLKLVLHGVLTIPNFFTTQMFF